MCGWCGALAAVVVALGRGEERHRSTVVAMARAAWQEKTREDACRSRGGAPISALFLMAPCRVRSPAIYLYCVHTMRAVGELGCGGRLERTARETRDPSSGGPPLWAGAQGSGVHGVQAQAEKGAAGYQVRAVGDAMLHASRSVAVVLCCRPQRRSNQHESCANRPSRPGSLPIVRHL